MKVAFYCFMYFVGTLALHLIKSEWREQPNIASLSLLAWRMFDLPHPTCLALVRPNVEGPCQSMQASSLLPHRRPSPTGRPPFVAVAAAEAATRPHCRPVCSATPSRLSISLPRRILFLFFCAFFLSLSPFSSPPSSYPLQSIFSAARESPALSASLPPTIATLSLPHSPMPSRTMTASSFTSTSCSPHF